MAAALRRRSGAALANGAPIVIEDDAHNLPIIIEDS
jgi:hypothetical protein